MRLLGYYLLVEWKLMLRSALFWVIMLSVAGLFYLATLIGNEINDIGLSVSSMLYFYLSPVFLIAQFLSVAAARRETINNTRLIHDSLPYPSWQVVGARLLALIIPFSLFALIPAVFYVIKGLMNDIAFTTLLPGLFVLCTYVVPAAFTCVLSYWIGTWTRKRVVYLFSFAIILSLIIFARLLFSMFLPVHWVHLVDMGLTDLLSLRYYSELWGFTIDGTFWSHRILYVGLTFLLAGLAIWRLLKQRNEQQEQLKVMSFIGVAIVICIFAMFSYSSIWLERVNAFKDEVHFYKQELTLQNTQLFQHQVIQQFLLGNEVTPLGSGFIANPLSEQLKQDLLIAQQYRSLSVSSYDLQMTIGTDHKLDVQASLQLIHQMDQVMNRFPVSLRHVFEIDSISINGVITEFEWEPYKDVIWIEAIEAIPADEMFVLSLSYSGQVDEWYLRKGSRAVDEYWERRVFIDQDKLFLPAFYGWYPTPGNHRLAEYELSRFGFYSRPNYTRLSDEIRENMNAHQPADFDVTVRMEHELPIFSNGVFLKHESGENKQWWKFTAKASDGFHLFGGNIKRWTAESDPQKSMILSKFVAEREAKQITEHIVSYYNELSALIELLNPNSHFPKEMTILRANYPASLDLIYGNHTPIQQYENSTFYLPYMFTPARPMTWYQHRLISGNLIERYVWGSQPLLINANRFSGMFIDLITRYVEHALYAEEGTLFSSVNQRMSGPSSVYKTLNSLYDQAGHDKFVDIIQQIVDFIKSIDQEERLPMSTLDQMLANFLSLLEGDGL